MEWQQTLIDKAAKVCGGQSKLAMMLGVRPQIVSDWKAGRRPMQPDTAIEIADLANENPEEWALIAVLGNTNPSKLQKVRQILGKCLLAGAMATSPISYAAGESDPNSGSKRQYSPKGNIHARMHTLNKLYIVLSEITSRAWSRLRHIAPLRDAIRTARGVQLAC